MKAFSSDQLRELNSQSSTGRFVEAVKFIRNMELPNEFEYFIRNPRPVNFKGNIYLPLDMEFGGLKTSVAMELPSTTISLANLGGSVIDYIEDDDVELNGNDVWMQILFIDMFGQVSLLEEMRFQVELLVADYHTSATFHLGVNHSLNDPIPRYTMEVQEFPGLKADTIRVGS